MRGNSSNDREKFGTYTRDGYTGLDYADQRYYASTYGRFDTPDPSYKSARLSDPGSFNRYSYSSLDPVNRNDPNGLCDVVLAGIAMASPNSGDLLDYGSDKITVFPYSAFANTTDLAGAFGSRLMGVLEVAAQRLGPTSSSYAAVVGLIMASQDGKPINVTAFSGGAGAFTSAVNFLNANGGSSVTSLINNITYVEPGAAGAVYQNGQTMTITAAAQYRAELLSPNRLVTELPRPAIIDPTGKELVALAAPPGFGPRHGWNDEATELLFDHFSSGETGVRGQFDRVWNSLFGGLGVAGEGVHGEHIRIVNTKSGAVCFDLESEDAPFGLSRGYHADLSPDGRRVAVTTTRELRVYAVPDDCAKR